jgi:hypothetical protein
MRNVLAHAGRQGRRVVSAFIGTAFVQDDAAAVSAQWRQVANQLRSKVPKLAALFGGTAKAALGKKTTGTSGPGLQTKNAWNTSDLVCRTGEAFFLAATRVLS